MLIEFSIKVLNKNGTFIRTQNVFACDYEMAKCMVAAYCLGDDEYVD